MVKGLSRIPVISQFGLNGATLKKVRGLFAVGQAVIITHKVNTSIHLSNIPINSQYWMGVFISPHVHQQRAAQADLMAKAVMAVTYVIV
jgi:hypothetical protein